ncbi:RsmB/NOP family class I SAM-dependent RNA methyltransferase [Gorillibacterium sp. sgz5001074]|uniref:RsmB/NOP family class I SAM-dependent RNA methyltransferase n=1 Tax=Gorillibacterium sp. sgz5001074 TaxID=3446695 RepID=UPI003F66839E
MRNLLPPAFVGRVTDMLGPEAEPFLASYDAPRSFGLRLNPAKWSAEAPEFAELMPLFGLEPIPWCPTGYYYAEEARPGKHPYHAAGLYYLQEPSAMSSAELLAPQPGETVLDLAAAPGGKATQIAAKLGPDGLLIANEIHPARAQILSENLERMGAANAVAVNAPPDKLAERFPAFFDRIMLDAPCSGEGMFRKDPDAMKEWSPAHVEMCAARQLDIVRHAAAMLKPGGVLGYSTCTFNREENEELIQAVLRECPALELERTERIWPHLTRGEGHFVAVLRHAGGSENTDENARTRKAGRVKPPSRQTAEAMAQFQAFAAEYLPAMPELPAGEPILFGEQLYWLPHGRGGRFHAGLLEGLKAPRPGLHLATMKKNRVEPAHALALAMPLSAFRGAARFALSSPELDAYLRGHAVQAPEGVPSGWVPVCAGRFPLGWAKLSEGQLKNHLPKGLRKL